MAKKRCLMLGGSNMGGGWLRRIWPNFADRMEIVALVDIKPEVLSDAGDFLGLPANRRFTDMAAAFDQVDADFCTIAIPPAFHKQAVLHAVRRQMPILSEKPIADTWESALEIYRAVKRADIKMQVVQNYRYNAPMQTFRQVLRTGDLGRINYIMGRFAQDYRVYNSWGAPFRFAMPHALLIEGAVHHFDMLRNLSGGDCATLSGYEWNPPWSTSKGEFGNLYVMAMTNGVHACYEGNGTAAGAQNGWRKEYYRAECEAGAVTVSRDEVVRIQRFTPGGKLEEEEVPTLKPDYEGHPWIGREFLDWLDGGATPATVIDDNLKTNAMLFAAIEASRSGTVVNVAAMVDEAVRSVQATAATS